MYESAFFDLGTRDYLIGYSQVRSAKSVPKLILRRCLVLFLVVSNLYISNCLYGVVLYILLLIYSNVTSIKYAMLCDFS